jgi:iron complex outermembrane receptor protein
MAHGFHDPSEIQSMTTTQFTRSKAPAAQGSAFKLAPVALGCAVLLMAAGNVHAQDSTLSTVTVTGIRAAIESAISVKKGSENIVEAVSSEDLGKLPDNSIAESIARLPGVSAQRNRTTGKASDVSVRGMSPDFNGALLNGREQATAGDARGASFDQFPSELLSSVLIYKTPDAGLLGQGLASTIDMRTVRPLDFKTRTISANLRKQRTGISTGQDEGNGDRKSVSYVDQFMDRTIGIALGFTQMQEHGAAAGNPNNWGGWTFDRQWQGKNVTVPGGFGGDIAQTDQERKGLMAVLQFKPSKDFESTIDFFSSKGSTFNKATGIEANVAANCPGDLGNFCYDKPSKLTAATVNAAGFAETGTIDNWKGSIRNHIYGENDEFESYGWNNKFKLGGWSAIADLGHSRSLRTGGRLETTAGLPGNAAGGTLSWTGFTSGGSFPKFSSSVNYADASIIKLTDVFGWSGDTKSDGTVRIRAEDTPQAGYVAQPTVEDKLDSFRVSGKTPWSFGPVAAVELGVNYSKRSKESAANEGRLVIRGSSDPYAGAAMPGGSVVTSVSGIPILSFNPAGTVGSIYDVAPKVDSPIWAKNWNVTEKVTTSFAKADLDGEVMGLSYVGNFGVQMVNTDQSSSGYSLDSSLCVGNTAATCPANVVGGGKTYTDFNPSLNLSFNVGADQVVRVGMAKVMSRPNMSDMRPGFSFGVDGTGGAAILKGDGGNINLEPFRANSADLSYERYFGKKGYFSVAGFYKDLNSFIYKTGQAFDFKPYVTSKTALPPNGSTQGILTIARNGTGGKISGYELAASLPFSMMAKQLDGFGAQLNYSSTNSSVSIPSASFATNGGAGDVSELPMPGLSKDVINMKFYYEANGWQFAVSQRRRSDFLGAVIDVTNDQRALTYVRGESVTDLQAGYEFNTGYLKGLSVLLQANNINNTEFEQYNPKTGETTQKTAYGKTYLMGLNYKF